MSVHLYRSDRGAILVQVAVAVLVLVGFLVFVVDSGVQWLGRTQAQNAADAGALAGALARAYDETGDVPAESGRTYQSARLTAESNPVWGEPGAVEVLYPCPPGWARGNLPPKCVRVNVYRDGRFGSAPLPMVFGSVLGLTEQGVRATATALVGVGNATDCLRPFVVADKWVHGVSPVDRYNHWVEDDGDVDELDPSDSYQPAGPGGPGSGYRVPSDVGLYRVLKGGNDPMSDTDPIVSNWMLPVRLPTGAGGYLSGDADFEDAIATCIRTPVRIGTYLPTEDDEMTGPTETGVADLLAQDPTASFNPVTKTVEGSCAPACAPFSPRIVPIAVFHVDDYQYRRAADDWTVCPVAGRCVKVVNILGFFVMGTIGEDIPGYLMMLPGVSVGGPTVGEQASFLKTIQLIR